MSFGAPMLEKIVKRLKGWNNFCFLEEDILWCSPVGVAILFVICSGLRFQMSLRVRYKKMMRHFVMGGWWEGKKDHLVNWEVFSKEKNGLAIGNIVARNIALLLSLANGCRDSVKSKTHYGSPLLGVSLGFKRMEGILLWFIGQLWISLEIHLSFSRFIFCLFKGE